jgi:hypothetical protein
MGPFAVRCDIGGFFFFFPVLFVSCPFKVGDIILGTKIGAEKGHYLFNVYLH